MSWLIFFVFKGIKNGQYNRHPVKKWSIWRHLEHVAVIYFPKMVLVLTWRTSKLPKYVLKNTKNDIEMRLCTPWEFSPIWAYGHMGICEKNMAKWGIPEKSIKNVAQGCWNQVRRTLRSKVMANNFFRKENALYFTL